MMKREEIAKHVAEVLDSHLALTEKVQETDEIVRDLGADSLDRLDMLVDLEQAFDIDASDKDAEGIVTVMGLIDLIGRKLEEK